MIVCETLLTIDITVKIIPVLSIWIVIKRISFFIIQACNGFVIKMVILNVDQEIVLKYSSLGVVRIGILQHLWIIKIKAYIQERKKCSCSIIIVKE